MFENQQKYDVHRSKCQEKVEFPENPSIAFQCLKCSQSFASVEKMEHHNSICKATQKKMENISDDISIISEIKSPQIGQTKISGFKFGHCILCIKPFMYCDHFQKGMKYINGKKRKCIKCNQTFTGIEMSIHHYKTCFEDHGQGIIVESAHSNRCRFKHCRKWIGTQKELTKHVSTCALKCYTCNTTFPTTLLAQIHRKICKTFKNVMQKHPANGAADGVSWICTLCSDLTFQHVGTAFIHVRDTHGDPKDVMILKTLGVSGINFPKNQKPMPASFQPLPVTEIPNNEQSLQPTPVLIPLTKKSRSEENETPLRRSKRARVGPKRYNQKLEGLEESDDKCQDSPSLISTFENQAQKLINEIKYPIKNEIIQHQEKSVASEELPELTLSVGEIKDEPIEELDDNPVMPKITSTTSLVESAIHMHELEFEQSPDEVEEDNLEISTVYDCPICSKKYLTIEIAEKHIEVYHKIPTEMQYVLGLKIQATTL